MRTAKKLAVGGGGFRRATIQSANMNGTRRCAAGALGRAQRPHVDAAVGYSSSDWVARVLPATPAPQAKVGGLSAPPFRSPGAPCRATPTTPPVPGTARHGLPAAHDAVAGCCRCAALKCCHYAKRYLLALQVAPQARWAFALGSWPLSQGENALRPPGGAGSPAPGSGVGGRRLCVRVCVRLDVERWASPGLVQRRRCPL